MSLTTRLVTAISDENIEELNKLIIICDYLHKGMPEYEYDNNRYTIKDLPSDIKYEEAKETLKRLQELNITMMLPQMKNSKNETDQMNQNVIMFMDGIQITSTIPEIYNCILMPKFDGCSLGVELIKYNETWVVNRAHTRGNDDLAGKRRCQDKTELLSKVFDLSNFNEILKSITDEDTKFELKYKDTSIVGNNNPVLETIIDINELTKICIRGEFVAKNKDNDLEMTPVGISAGCLNSIDYKHAEYLTFIPFEITKLFIDETYFIPTQECALRFMKKYKLIEYTSLKLKKIDDNMNMEKILQKFESILSNPLDGIVYCNSDWTYPNTIDETSNKVNYGKYKWKRTNIRQTKLIDIQYSIGKTGKLTPSFIFDTVMINNKNYTKAKTSFKQIEEFYKVTKLHRGTICDLELKSDISPYICTVYETDNETDEYLEKITHCPYCNSLLKYEMKKDESVTVTCVNDLCKGVLVEKCADFIKQIHYSGISSVTIFKIFDDSDDYDFEKLYEEKLQSKEHLSVVGRKDKIIYSPKSMKQRMQNATKQSFDNIIINIDSDTFLICLSLYTKAQLTKINYGEKNTMLYCLKNNIEYRALLTDKGYFIDNLINFIEKKYM